MTKNTNKAVETGEPVLNNAQKNEEVVTEQKKNQNKQTNQNKQIGRASCRERV